MLSLYLELFAYFIRCRLKRHLVISCISPPGKAERYGVETGSYFIFIY